ncbi:MAG: FAD-binding oxidoreductase [Bacteroidales bacterium]|nr:FAD-binding oxidoreductase [Bacteroidales bacterium]
MLQGNYRIIYDRLIEIIEKKRIFHDPLHALAFGTDASFYRLIPRLVVMAEDEEEVSFILKQASELSIPVTFRGAGTSLSGQAITDSLLLMTCDGWKGYRVKDNGAAISCQPGLTGGKLNAILAPYGRKLGPDPASVNSATIGGIAANNASGMSSGTDKTSLETVRSMRIILSDGTILDTGDKTSRDSFMLTHKEFTDNLRELSESVKNNSSLAEKIRKKFLLKNTTGYSLNALTEYSDPFKIIEHLMIGSEGTLGFISEITLNTVPELPCKASSLIIFPDAGKACKAVAKLKKAPVSAAELIDRAGLRAVENEAGYPAYLKQLGNDCCALLVETRAGDQKELQKNIQTILKTIEDIPVEVPVRFTDIPSEYQLLWNVRSGLFPSIGGMRRAGTTVIIEDIALPISSLADAISDLRRLFIKYGYDEAVIYGHALEGNLHFVFTQDFSSQDEVGRYAKFMDEVAELVAVKYEGSLKAEHGTGRNMAPFVEMEWGREAYEVMHVIKKLFDPLNILNPGVILNNDPEIHLKNLKPLPVSNEIIDKCIECGFCEPACVSAGLTLTPRQRIAVYREITSLISSGREPHMALSLSKSFRYPGDQTCAVDGLCASTCPVKIDTGKLIKELRAESIGRNHRTADWIAKHMGLVTAMGRRTLSLVSLFHLLFGTTLFRVITSGLRKLSGNRIPLWNKYMPKGAAKVNIREGGVTGGERKVVYFPSCINRSMGVSLDYNGEVQLTQKMTELLARGGYEIIYPENLNDLCCGMAFSSKGYFAAAERKSRQLEESLLTASNGGEYPVLCDMSPCLFTMKENMSPPLRLYEPVEFIADFLLPRLQIKPLDEIVAVFPVCSMKKMGLEPKLLDLARACASRVIVPEANCCGFAGDRGFTYPELNEHGLRNLKEQLPESVRYGYSNSRTCEIGLSLHSGISFRSIVYLVDQVSSPELSSDQSAEASRAKHAAPTAPARSPN